MPKITLRRPEKLGKYLNHRRLRETSTFLFLLWTINSGLEFLLTAIFLRLSSSLLWRVNAF
jgi:hypothetical protein